MNETFESEKGITEFPQEHYTIFLPFNIVKPLSEFHGIQFWASLHIEEQL